jgi:sec-independent protein translocase protein TatC
MRKKPKKPTAPRPAKASLATSDKLPLAQHIHELRRRLFYVAACVAVGAAVTYALERQLVAALLRPSHGQQFIYTSPIGGMNFLFSVCLDVGLVIASPVIIYQLLAFLSPLMRNSTRKFIVMSSAAAGIVALAGIFFGYFVGLPSALHFLLHQFTTVQVRPLITIQSYMSFVALYLFGSALMFQLPLILFIINRIKPLKPSKLLKYERHLIIFAFITAFIMNPTPNIIDQMMVVVPIIVMYQVGIGVVWLVNRSQKPELIDKLREEDAQRQAERASRSLLPLVATDPLPAFAPVEVPSTPIDEEATIVANAAPESFDRPRPYATSSPAPRRSYVALRGQLIQ